MNEVVGEINNRVSTTEVSEKVSKSIVQQETGDKKEAVKYKAEPLADTGKTEIVRNELQSLAPRTSSAKPVEQQDTNSKQKFTLKPLERLRNNLSYPSSPFLRKLRFVPLGADLGATTALLTGIPLEFSTPILVGAVAFNAAYMAERLRFNRAANKISDLMRVYKVASPKNKVFQDGTNVDKGDIVGELHMEGGNVRREWGKMSHFKRGKAMVEEEINSLMSLAQLCRTNNESVAEMSAFYGISDIIRPELMKRIGFEVEDADSDILTKLDIKIKRIRALGIMGGLKASVGKFNEAWITRDALVGSIPTIENYRQTFSKKSSPSGLVNIATA